MAWPPVYRGDEPGGQCRLTATELVAPLEFGEGEGGDLDLPVVRWRHDL
ncbi:MAG: hypothetical protein K8U57_14920 [Planctomycetes bacterium]|nr:hypothetical protein [Planctomycetota bacterium]